MAKIRRRFKSGGSGSASKGGSISTNSSLGVGNQARSYKTGSINSGLNINYNNARPYASQVGSTPAGEPLSVLGRPLRRNNVPFRSDFSNGMTLAQRRANLGVNNVQRQTGELDSFGQPQYAPPIYRGSRQAFDQVPLSFRTNNGLRSDRVQRQLDANALSYNPATQASNGGIYSTQTEQIVPATQANYTPSRSTGDFKLSSPQVKNYSSTVSLYGKPTTSQTSSLSQQSNTTPAQPGAVSGDTLKKKESSLLQTVDETERYYQEIDKLEEQDYNNRKKYLQDFYQNSINAIDSQSNSFMNTLAAQIDASKKATLNAIQAGGGLGYDAMGRPTVDTLGFQNYLDTMYGYQLAREQDKMEQDALAKKAELQANIANSMSQLDRAVFEGKRDRYMSKIDAINAQKQAEMDRILKEYELQSKYDLLGAELSSKERIAQLNEATRRYGYDVGYKSDVYGENIDYQIAQLNDTGKDRRQAIAIQNDEIARNAEIEGQLDEARTKLQPKISTAVINRNPALVIAYYKELMGKGESLDNIASDLDLMIQQENSDPSNIDGPIGEDFRSTVISALGGGTSNVNQYYDDAGIFNY